MLKVNIKDMIAGYFIGDFEPSILKAKGFEVALKKFKPGFYNGHYFRKIDTEVIVIISGRVKINGCIYKANDIVAIEPNEVKEFFTLTEVKCIIIRFPGTKKDVYDKENLSLDEVVNVYKDMLDLVTTDKQKEIIQNIDNKINFSEISIVIQGSVDGTYTKLCLESVRRYLPGATIILSTWEGTNVQNLEYDIVLLNKDPGGANHNRFSKLTVRNNANRQLLSTQKGLEQVKTKYTLKLRSDLLLTSNDFLKFFDLYSKRKEKYKLFKSRILISEVFTRKNFHYFSDDKKRHVVPKPFHPSDWFLFGLTEDLNTYFRDTELLKENELSNYNFFKNIDRIKENWYPWNWRYATEQYYCYSAFKRNFDDIQFDDLTDWNEENIRQSETAILNNFTILSFIHHKIVCQKYPNLFNENNGNSYSEKGLLTHDYFINYYKDYCDN